MSPKRFLKRHFGGDRERFASHHLWLQRLGLQLHDHELWHFGRRSVAGGVSVGLFYAFLPLPIQMLCALLTALVLRVNLPLAMACTWITNPFTFAPVFVFAYKVGAMLTGVHAELSDDKMSVQVLVQAIDSVGYPLLVGCLVCGASVAALANVTVRWAWRWHVQHRWRKRRKQRLSRQARKLPRPPRA